MRARLAAVEQKIKRATANMLQLDGDEMGAAREVLDEWRAEKRGLVRELEALEAASVQSPEQHAQATIARLVEMREAIRDTNPHRARAVLKALIRTIDLWWVPHGPAGRNRFTRGELILTQTAQVAVATEDQPESGCRRKPHDGPSVKRPR